MDIWIIVSGILIGFGTMISLSFLGWLNRPSRLPKVETLCPGLEAAMEETTFPKLHWLGHASFRIEWGDRVVLLDPVLAPRVSVAARQMAKPPLSVLENVDDVLLSHAHMDHMDPWTLSRISATRMHLPEKSERFLKGEWMAHHDWHRFSMNETFACGSLQVTVVPAVHGGWRFPWQKGFFACGFVISKGDVTLYFAGDTAWGDHFQEIADRFHPDLAILPIGAYAPRWFLKSRHMNPEEAVQAASILKPRFVIPCHFGTYRVSLEPMGEPLRRFQAVHAQR